jgi:hypothetical protein
MPKPDLLTPVRPPKDLHPNFINLISPDLNAPARGMLREVYAEFPDPDGNFVEQFQTKGFDARTFELFLFAMFKDLGHHIERERRLDFILSRDGQTAGVEAVVASPPHNDGITPYTHDPPIWSPEELQEYTQQDMAIRLGSPLFSKLQKKYWTLPQAKGKPLIFAIENFYPGALHLADSTLSRYLFGLASHSHYDADGKLIGTHARIDKHTSGAKEIPSGFFTQPDAENVSAVLFSNSGTIAKFNRMGHQGAYHSHAVRMIRWGTSYRFDSNSTWPEMFLYEVGDPSWGVESWREGTVLFLNPRAKYPVSRGWLGASVEQYLEDGRIVAKLAEPFHPFGSNTVICPGDTPTLLLQSHMDEFVHRVLEEYPTLRPDPEPENSH